MNEIWHESIIKFPEPKNVKVVDVMQVLKVINGTEDVSLAEINKAILNLRQYDLLVVDE